MAEVNDIPLPRDLRIGRAIIGIVGLDIALNRVTGNRDLDENTAADQVFAEIAANNYIPDSAVDKYRQAIRAEIRRLRGGGKEKREDLVIRILGPGCVACNNLQKLVLSAMAEMGVAADIFQVHDPDEIGRFGVTRTPALVINDEIKSVGTHPPRGQIEEWLREANP